MRWPQGELLARRAMATQAERPPEAVLDDVAALARGLFEEARSRGLRPAGVGIGVPELVDLEGRITSAHRIDWRRIDWRRLPREHPLAALGRVRIEADVRAAALGEALFGAGRRFRIFAYVTVGTGISSTLVLDGRPFAGARGNALVLATSPIALPCTRCGEIVEAALEDLASGPGLARRYRQLCPGPAARGEDVLAAARAGDAAALRAVEEAGEALGSGVALLVNVLDPEAVVVGGGLGLAGGLFWDAFEASTRRLPILPAGLGVDAGLIGAAAAVCRG
jgi:glucokinase